MKWIKPRKCEAGHCPEVAVAADLGLIAIRNSQEPDKILMFDRADWAHLVAEMRSLTPFDIDPGTDVIV